MEMLQDLEVRPAQFDVLLSLRKKASALVSQSESEELLAEAVAILSGRPLPCAYSREQMANALREAESDYSNGRFISHSTICERYGV